MKRIICLFAALCLSLCFAACRSTGDVGSDVSYIYVYEEASSVGSASSQVEASSVVETSVPSSKKQTATSSKKAGISSAKTSSKKTANISSKKVYVDAATDFSNKVTIVGRWKCVQEIRGETASDVSKQGQFYIFESTGGMESYYQNKSMITYDGYTLKKEKTTDTYEEGKITFEYYGRKITLGYKVEVGKLTLWSLNATADNTKTIYERVGFPAQ